MKTTISYMNFTYILSSYTTTIKFYSYFVVDSIQFLIEKSDILQYLMKMKIIKKKKKFEMKKKHKNLAERRVKQKEQMKKK